MSMTGRSKAWTIIGPDGKTGMLPSRPRRAQLVACCEHLNATNGGGYRIVREAETEFGAWAMDGSPLGDLHEDGGA